MAKNKNTFSELDPLRCLSVAPGEVQQRIIASGNLTLDEINTFFGKRQEQ